MVILGRYIWGLFWRLGKAGWRLLRFGFAFFLLFSSRVEVSARLYIEGGSLGYCEIEMRAVEVCPFDQV
jgi:hypothetical protein